MGLINSISYTPTRGEYTIGEFMKTDPIRQTKSFDCNVSLMNMYHEVKPESLLDKFKKFFKRGPVVKMYYLILKLSVTSSSGNSYIVFIKLNPDYDMSNWADNKIKVYCSCPDFKFKSSYNLARRNSLFLTDRIKINLGQALTTAPKTIKPSPICKHGFAAINWVVSNYGNIMNMI